MIARVRFAKYGTLKFIGHLDVMRYFQKALRRAELDVAYSKGFHPHQIMSFAAPLGLGITSDGEYMDIELCSIGDCDDYLNRLNEVMAEGFSILSFRFLDERKEGRKQEAAMAQVSAADYMISLKDGYLSGFSSNDHFYQEISTFVEQPNIIVQKKTKKSEAKLDIRPFLYQLAFTHSDFYQEELQGGQVPVPKLDGTCHAESYQNGLRLFCRLAAGSSMNIKPELLLLAFYQQKGLAWQEAAFQIHRMELYRGTFLDALKQDALRPL